MAEAYTIDDIFQKKLTLLLPYCIIRYKKNNKETDEETDEETLRKLTPEYKRIVNYLNQELLSKGKGKEYRYIVDLIIRVADYPMCRKTPCFSYGDIRHFHRIYASN